MSKKRTKTTPFPTPLIILGIIGIIAVIGIHRAGIYTDNNARPRSKAASDYGNWQKIENDKALFFSQIFLDRSRTYITIPIKFDRQPLMIWLTLNASPSAQPQSFLVTHPAFDNLTWPKVSAGTIHLYQRQKTYASIDALLKNPPPSNRLAIDPTIHDLPTFSQIQGYPVDNNLSLESVDYLLTTYTNPKIENGVYYYENIIDASQGIINSNNNLTWQLYAPQASSASAYYLGQIHIDYNRNQ